MLIEPKKIIEVDNVKDFVQKFRLEEKFEKKYKIKAEDYRDYDLIEQEVIEKLLSEEKKSYVVIFIDNDNGGFFKIIEIEVVTKN